MKKILFALALVATSVAGLVACTEEESFNPYAKESSIKIVSSNISFDAAAQSGEVVFEADGTVTAECTSDWCKATVNGNKLIVTVPENISFEGRSTTVTLKCGDEQMKLYPHQQGMLFSFADQSVSVEMKGGSVEINGASTFDVTVSADDWIAYEKTDYGYLLTIKTNDSGNVRNGKFVISCGDAKTTYSITQKFERSFAGSYTMTYFTDNACTKSASKDVTISRPTADDPNSYLLSGLCNWDIPMHYDDVNNELFINNAQYIGQSDTLGVFVTVSYSTLDKASFYVGYSTAASYNVTFSYQLNDGKYTIDLFDSAKRINTERLSQGFSIYTFACKEGESLTTDLRKSSLMSVRQPKLVQK